MSLGWSVFAESLHEDRLKEDLADGIKAAIELYYRDYTGVESLYDEPAISHLLQELLDALAWSGANDLDLRELICEVEDELLAAGARDCDGVIRRFTTERPKEDD